MKGQAVRVLAVAGLDPSGRAGLLADVGTIRALGAEACGVASALTAQGRRTFAASGVAPKLLSSQLESVRELFRLDAVKLGMVADAAGLRAIRRALRGLEAPWVVDPVGRTSRGQRLSSLKAGDYLSLASDQVVLTPNLEEARWLLGLRRPLMTVEDAAEAAAALGRAGFLGVVVKGGHRSGRPTDVVWSKRGVSFLEATRLARKSSHRGTGCRHASAVSVGLARGVDLSTAARRAQGFVRGFLRR